MTTVDNSVVEKTATGGETAKQRRIFKIIVLGDSNVGKTCLTFRFCVGKFPDRTEATIGVDFREKTVDVENENIKVSMLLFWPLLLLLSLLLFSSPTEQRPPSGKRPSTSKAKT